LNTGSTSDASPDILAAKISCSKLSFMHYAANDKTSDQVPGTNTGAKTTLVTQFEWFATGFEYHIYSFFVRT
jgi:hypothetical protein